jgi:predicted glycoside hydrolase/deacetylase ChbG (UPF0249 family)
MLHLIVNADDLGRSPEVNQAIFKWMERGRLSSASLLANGPGLEEALGRLPEFSGCSFGVHLNVEEFPPLRPAPALAPLLDGEGHLTKRLRSTRRTPALLRAVYGEWCAQIEKLRSRGVQPSHLDSHYHAHSLPEMLPLLAALRRRYGIPCARVAMNLFEPGERKPVHLRVFKRLYNAALRGLCGFRTTNALAFLQTGFRVPARDLERLGTVELMSHPGHSGFEDETRLLANLSDGRLPPHRLISYHDLARR